MLLVPNFFYKRPHVAEFDLAGVVVDGNDTDLSEGDQVYGFLGVGKSNFSQFANAGIEANYYHALLRNTTQNTSRSPISVH